MLAGGEPGYGACLESLLLCAARAGCPAAAIAGEIPHCRGDDTHYDQDARPPNGDYAVAFRRQRIRLATWLRTTEG